MSPAAGTESNGGHPRPQGGLASGTSDGQAPEAPLRVALLDAVLSTVPEFVIVVGRDLTIRYINRLQPGYRLEDVIGTDALGYLHGEHKTRMRDAIEAAFDGQESSLEVEGDGPDGRPTPYRTTCRALPSDGGEPTVALICRDLSPEVEAAREIEHRTRELERSNRDLETFAYAASHDLQEPLRVVDGYLRLLDDDVGDRLGEARMFLEEAAKATVRMQHLIDDLLAFARVGAKGAALVAVDSGDALQAALSNLSMAVADADATVERHDLPMVAADEGQMTQVFQNLVGNALKFRGEAAPHIDVFATQEDGLWRFAIRDNGIGIRPDDQERLFVVFQRLHRRDVPGNGIGLALCKRIVERHGGTIGVDSEPGQGSTFWFTWPGAVA